MKEEGRWRRRRRNLFCLYSLKKLNEQVFKHFQVMALIVGAPYRPHGKSHREQLKIEKKRSFR